MSQVKADEQLGGRERKPPITDEQIGHLRRSANEAASYKELIRLQPDRVLSLLDEIEQNRRGEFICSKCHLRKDAETNYSEAPF